MAARHRYPFTSPRPHEARALAIAAAFLRRAANEIDTHQLTPFAVQCSASLEGDLSSLMLSAGALCETVVELAAK